MRDYQKALQVENGAFESHITSLRIQMAQVPELHRRQRSILSERFPTYGFYGEETGQHAMTAENVWLVDPIDGTKSFVRECPFFSTQIALLRGGQLVLGVSSAPAYGELAWAERGAWVMAVGSPT